MKRSLKTDIGDGAVTHAYKADRARVIEALNRALASEIVSFLAYKSHQLMAKGINSQPVATEFLQHATDELMHMDLVGHRITQLGGVPNMDPDGIKERGRADYGVAGTLRAMLEEDLAGERVAIEFYTDTIRWIGYDDPTTRRLFEDILKLEEEHADDLANLLDTLPGE